MNTLIAVYNADVINDKNQIAINTANFIKERLDIIEEELGNVETNIETYKKEHQLTDVSTAAEMFVQESNQYKQESVALEMQKTLVGYLKEYLVDPRKGSELLPVNTGIDDLNIESQINEYNALLLKRDKLIENSSDRNPVVMDLNDSLNAMKQIMLRAIDNVMTNLNIKLRNLRQRELKASSRISAVPTQQRQMLSIERQQKIKEELYLYLLNKREENALSEAITESNARVVDAADGSNAPIAPDTKKILLVAFVIGCAIPGAIIFGMLFLDTTVRTRKDVEDAVSIPFLGEIPLRDKKNKDEIVVRENGRDSISEAFRIVRTNMDFMRVKAKDMKVVMFTSFNPNAGKTFVSMNLAMSFALTRKKVILVDLDIRKGTLSGHVSGSTNMGITNYLSGKVDDINSIIKKEELATNLDIIHTGPVPPNPSELLLSDRLEALIEELKKRYDYIILDNVPAGLVADAAIVNRVADLTIYILRAGLMDRRQLPELEKLYRQGKFRNMSLVVCLFITLMYTGSVILKRWKKSDMMIISMEMESV